MKRNVNTRKFNEISESSGSQGKYILMNAYSGKEEAFRK